MIKIHEHCVEVTNQKDSLSSLLTASKLLRHLEHYAKHPHEYFDPLESSEVREVFDGGVHALHRVLHFGTMSVTDKVTFVDALTMVTDVDQTDDYPASRLTVRIEPSDNEQNISLRFIYEEDRKDQPAEDIFLSLRRKAYEQKDRDLVERIRQQANSLSELT